MVKQPAVFVITAHPKSVIGTPAFRGPYSRLRGNHAVWVEQGAVAWRLIVMGQGTVREAASTLGLSPTTAWRRAWWFEDWIARPRFYGLKPGPVPHQRGTRAVPRGRAVSLPLDADDIFRQLLASGVTAETIAASWRTVPACIRDLAAAHMIREHLGDGDGDGDDGPRC